MIARTKQIAELADKIRQIERARPRPEVTAAASGRSRFECWLAESEELRGGLIECLSFGAGDGSTSLALLAIQQTVSRELLVVIDANRDWYAPAVAARGINLSSTLFVRPERTSDVLWSAEQALRTRGVGAVICEIDKLSPTAFRRLQLAAETGGTLGVLLRPERVRHQPSWAEFRFLVRPLASPDSLADGQRRRWRVELLKGRGQFRRKSAVWELRDEPTDLHLVSELACATPAA